MNSMEMCKLSIRRYKPGAIDPPRFETFEVAAGQDRSASILDCLERIRLNQDPTLMYRHSCHHGSCGTCACQINGTPRLACTTKLSQLSADPVIIEPLEGFDCIADLVVNMDDFFKHIDCTWPYLQTDQSADAPSPPSGIPAWSRLEDCIECGCCVSACPAVQVNSAFIGPAALTAVHRQYSKFRQQRERLLAIAGGPRGVNGCQRALVCSKVCPTRVYPARLIEELRRRLKTPSSA